MSGLPKISVQRLFEDMDGLRVVERCTYRLTEVVVMAICAVLRGAETWTEVEEFGASKREWSGKFLKLAQGIPWHDTFRRVFSILPADDFEKRFQEWVEQTFQVESGQVIAIDGKTIQGTGLRALPQRMGAPRRDRLGTAKSGRAKQRNHGHSAIVRRVIVDRQYRDVGRDGQPNQNRPENHR